ncbi:DUF4142 domain-containing protein [Amycolatopsis sp. MtRt-6]|uniref:DUF4142 domain-containing protein n=1 Tax=Amycolatopsis sp. MtRt-6 TaxID=2792782 RepID=UPI001A907C4B|nr:DUF4142 domain-containing protein [Amycolatopsis sp. MtRt-6]
MKARTALATAVLIGVLLPAAPAAAAPPPRAGVSTEDREYLNRAHQNNLFEIITGHLTDRASCAKVRQLGPRFAAHHTALDADLVGVATREGVPLYSVPEPLTRIADLAARSGPDFDKAWLHDQLAAHVSAIESSERETRQGWSPEVKDLAARSVPVLRHHLEEVVSALEACP